MSNKKKGEGYAAYTAGSTRKNRTVQVVSPLFPFLDYYRRYYFKLSPRRNNEISEQQTNIFYTAYTMRTIQELVAQTDGGADGSV